MPASTHRGQDIGNALSERCAKVRQPVPKLSNKQFTKKSFSFKIPDLVHRPTVAAVAGKNRRWMGLQISYHKCDTTLQQSVLCQFLFLFRSGSPQTSINTSKWGLNLILGYFKSLGAVFL